MKNIDSLPKNPLVSFPQRKGTVHLHVDHIVRLQSDSNYTIIHTVVGRPFIMAKGLKHYEKLLKPFDFIRLSRSHLVNKAHIAEVKGQCEVKVDDAFSIIPPRRKKMLIRSLLACTFTCFIYLNINAQAVSISESNVTPHYSAILDISSTSKGLLTPRLTSLQRASLPMPAEGLLVYDVDENKFFVLSNGSWKPIHSGNSTMIEDGDLDTKIQTEKFTDEDIIRVDIDGSERWRFRNHILESINSGESVYIGEDAGLNDDLSNNRSVGIGKKSLNSSITGLENCAIGMNSLFSNSTGSYNTAIGYGAMHENSVAGFNVAVGHLAMYKNENGYRNIAIGSGALWGNQHGYENTAVGESALYSGSYMHFNVAIGERALYNNQVDANTAVGTNSMENNTTGTQNTALGFQSLFSNSIGWNNVAMGYETMKNNLEGADNTATGSKSLRANESGTGNAAFGSHAMGNNTTGNENTAMGYLSMFSGVNSNWNCAFGSSAMEIGTTGEGNCAFGKSALQHCNGNNNVGVGNHAMKNTNAGGYNSAVGAFAMQSNISGNNNTCLGYSTLANNTANQNVAIGSNAMFSNISGHSNTAVGTDALKNSGFGTFNTAIGFNSGGMSINYSNTSSIGNGAIVTGNNHIVIGNSSISMIGGQVSWSTLSDARIKSNVCENVPGLALINKLKPVTYNVSVDSTMRFQSGGIDTTTWEGKYDIEKIRFTGFLAQDVHAAAESINYDFSAIHVPRDDDDLYSLRYSDFVMPLVKAVQELDKENDELRSQLLELKNQVMLLQAELRE